MAVHQGQWSLNRSAEIPKYWKHLAEMVSEIRESVTPQIANSNPGDRKIGPAHQDAKTIFST